MNKYRFSDFVTNNEFVARLAGAFICSGLIIFPVVSYAVAEFDTRFLHQIPGVNAIDIGRFNKNVIPPGTYYSDVYVNNEWRGRNEVHFYEGSSASNEINICITKELLMLIDALPNEVHEIDNTAKGCKYLTYSISLAKFQFNLSTLRLDINVPQAILTPRPRGYISPEQWQRGGTAAFFRYDVNHYRYHFQKKEDYQTYLGVWAGLNFHGWALRHRGYQTWNERKDYGYRGYETSLLHDIASLRAQFTLGDFNTNGELLENLSLRGVRISSDDRMLPSSLRGYAPVIRGVANSNAKVTIRQNGNVIYETTVPAGPFSIGDLYPSGFGGNLSVSITEADGHIRTFTVPFSGITQLLRPGASRWQIAAGRYRYSDRIFNDLVFQATYQHGVNNDVTINSSLSSAPHYLSGGAGLAFNTPVGTVSADLMLARTTFANTSATDHGYSIHANYTAKVPLTDTNINLAAYRYSSEKFWTLRDALIEKNINIINNPMQHMDFYRPKNQLQLIVNKDFGSGLGQLYLTGTTYSYWSQKGNHNEYQIGYSNIWNNVSYQLGFSQSRSFNGTKHDNRYFLSFSVPFAENSGTILTTTYNASREHRNNLQSTFSGVSGKDQEISYGISIAKQQIDNLTFYANSTYRSPYAVVRATIGDDDKDNRQMSAGISGAIVAHPFGLTASNDLSETFVIIHADGAKNAKIINGQGNNLDRWGNGILPFAIPYEKNQISIDPTNLAGDVEMSETSREIIPTANSSNLVLFSTQHGTPLIFDLKLEDGKLPPMGAEVTDFKGVNKGFISQGGRFFSRGLPEEGQIKVTWGVNANERCLFTYKKSTKVIKNDRPFIHKVTCKRGI